MSDPGKFRHDRSLYERPELPYRCGRAALWSRPCWQGATFNGKCGGEADCQPVRKGDRWECRRPQRGGGHCKSGPTPDGQCAHIHPPCIPRATLRRWRARSSILCVASVIALIAAFLNFSGGSSASLASIDPGPLSTLHQGFTKDQGCSACHVAHDLDPIGWLASAFFRQDQSGPCLQCHRFDAPERAPHNTVFEHRTDIGETECTACHTEHKGADFDPGKVDSVVCSNCHLPSFARFNEGHPGFAADFPHQVPNSIYFDHSKHLSEYFVDERWTKAKNRDEEFADRAKSSCIACHEIAEATREVTPRRYEAVCARCHQHQITDRELLVYSPEEVMPLTGLLLGLSAEDGKADGRARELLESMSEQSIDALAEALAADETGPDLQTLFAGLGPIGLGRAAGSWSRGEEYEPEVAPEADIRGWSVGEDSEGGQSLHYRPSGHADPLVRAWIEHAITTARSADDEDRRLAGEEAVAYLLDADEGPGACGKCHAAGVLSSATHALHWSYRGSAARPHTMYAHAPHISLLGPNRSCKTCHEIDARADYAAYFENDARTAEDFVSNFVSIPKETCEQCHRAGIVRFDCQLCHTYHRNAGFKVGFQERRTTDE